MVMNKKLILILFVTWTSFALAQEVSKESDYYPILNIPVPEGVILEVGGLCTMPNGNVAVSTRRGDIYIVENPGSSRPNFRLFASGLHEILGLRYKDDAFYCAQRSELTKISDRDGDGYADRYETVASWPLTGNYHEYSFGPVIDAEGNMYVTANVGFFNPEWWRGQSKAPWRGWTMQITEDGEIKPYATGMRSPCGIGIIDGKFFLADNQGDWIGSGSLVQVDKGDFTGHPGGLAWADRPESPVKLRTQQIYDKVDPRLAGPGEQPYKPQNIEDEKVVPLFSLEDELPSIKTPAVWLPHGVLGTSTSEIVVDETNGAFGPFAGQVLIGDQGQSKISRVFLEQVNGEYQGASFLFREGFKSGVLRMAWGHDNSLYVGQTARGWGSTGGQMYGFERVIWNGKTPFEMKAIRAMPDGFEVEFTQPVDRKSALNLENTQLTSFTYKYHPVYGSPAVDDKEVTVKGLKLSKDGTKLRIVTNDLRKHYVHEVVLTINSETGKSLLHNSGYYTLNNIPEGEKLTEAELDVKPSLKKKDEPKPVVKEVVKTEAAPKTKLAKRTTSLPSGWGKVDKTLQIKTVPGLKYSVTDITVKAGQKIKIEFENPDDMPHNLLIVEPGTADKVGQTALKLGIKGNSVDYVPDMKEVLYHTKLLSPGNNETIYILAPLKPGKYTFVCTYPGHYMSMRGTITVVE